MLRDSGLLQDLEQYAFSTTGQPMCIYGDPAYPLKVRLQGPFRDVYLTPQKQLYNQSMNSVRTSVEWLFADAQNYFKFTDFKKNLKVALISVGKMNVVSALLRNALTCLYGNETSQYFQLDPPSLQGEPCTTECFLTIQYPVCPGIFLGSKFFKQSKHCL